MKVLVTGASGFIGRHVVSALASKLGVEVVAVGRAPYLGAPTGVRQEVANLLTAGTAAEMMSRHRPTHLIHLAWNAIPGRFWTAPDNLDWAAATFALLRAFAEVGGERAVMAGSCAEYGWTGEGRLYEDSLLAPTTFYGAVKDATRRAVCAFGDQAGVEVAWGRVFWLYGPGEAAGRLVSDVAAALSRGEPVETTEGTQRRDFLHVEDVAGSFVAALLSKYSGPFNIGSGEATPVRRLIEILAEELGARNLVRFGALASLPGDPPFIAADITRLHDEIGFKPRYDLESGLRATAGWWRRTICG